MPIFDTIDVTLRVTLNRFDESQGLPFEYSKLVNTIQLFQVWKCAVFLERSFAPRALCLLRRRLHTLHGEDICHVGLFFENLLTFFFFFFQKLFMERLHVIGDEGDGEEVWWPTS